MEDAATMVGLAVDTAADAKAKLLELRDEATRVADELIPGMLKLVRELRDARMAAVSEIAQSLAALRDIRKFFLEDAYAEEVDRMERFVVLCREVQRLKQDGIFDAMADTAIRLSLKEASA